MRKNTSLYPFSWITCFLILSIWLASIYDLQKWTIIIYNYITKYTIILRCLYELQNKNNKKVVH